MPSRVTTSRPRVITTTPTRFPLTRQQEVLWVEYTLEPGHGGYHTAIQQRIEGPLDVERFRRSIHDVVLFFDGLRTQFVDEDGVALQEVVDDPGFPLPLVDLSEPDGVETDATRSRVQAFLTARLDEAIPLDKAPIFRGYLARSAADIVTFIGIIPHIVSDAFSALLLLEAISVAYHGGLEALADRYGASRRTIADYHAWLAENPPGDSMDFWREQLADATFRIDFGRGADPRVATMAGRRRYHTVQAGVATALKSLARRERTSLFVVVTAVWATLIHHVFGAEDQLVGYPVSIRPPGYAANFGFFVNMLALRVKLDRTTRLSALFAEVTAQRRAQSAHQRTPGLELVQMLRKHAPQFPGRLFNVGVSPTLVSRPALDLGPELVVQSQNIEPNHVAEELLLYFEMQPDELHLMLDFRTSLFDAAFAATLLHHLDRLLQGLAANPDATVGDLVLGAPLRFAGPTLPGEPEPIVASLSRLAATAPERVAVTLDGEATTWGEIERRSGAWARALGPRGGEIVALDIAPGPDLLSAMLACARAGAAWMPVATRPAARLVTVLEDSGANLLLTRDTAALPPLPCEVRQLDTLTAAPGPDPVPPSLERLAYVLYTSGSTGTPNGVRLTHRNLASRLRGLQHAWSIGPDDVFAQLTTATFDISVPEWLQPILGGGRIAVVPEADRTDPEAILEHVARDGVTVLNLVPALHGAVLDAARPGAYPTLRRVHNVGEQLPASIKLGFGRIFPRATLVDAYGPTEATVYATTDEVRADDNPNIGSIGRPLPDTLVRVLDVCGREQPALGLGELVIGGDGVGDGYHGLDVLTRERFFDEDGVRWYRTGDRARLLPDGRVEYLGRIDNQLKIRGFRIEAGDVEAPLRAHGAVRDAVVVARGPLGARRLAGYFVGDPVDPAALRAHLASRLPPYMIPTTFTRLEAFPVSASGKLDRRALPRPAATTRAEHVAPRTRRERELAELWSERLRIPVESVGIDDDFFTLGGDSLMLIQLAGTLRARGLITNPQTLLTHRTIVGLAPLLDRASAPASARVGAEAWPLLPRAVQFFDEDGLVAPAWWNRVLAFRFREAASVQSLRRAVARVLDHHPSLRSAFSDGEQRSVDRVDIDTVFAVVPPGRAWEEVDTAQRRFDLTRPPLFRVIAWHNGDQLAFAFVVHHLLVDLGAMRVLLEDVLSLLASPSPERLPLLSTTSLPAWSRHLRAAIPALRDERAHWTALPTVATQLPGVRAVPNLERDAISRDLSLSAAATRRLAAKGVLGHAVYAAVAEAIGEATGEDHVLVETTAHARAGSSPLLAAVDLSRTVGWLNALFPLVLRRGRYPLAAASDLEAVPHQGIHWPILRYTDPEGVTALGHVATPSVYVNYMGRVDNVPGSDAQPVIPLVLPASLSPVAPQNVRRHDLHLEAAVIDNRLGLRAIWSPLRLTTEVVDATLERLLAALTRFGR